MKINLIIIACLSFAACGKTPEIENEVSVAKKAVLADLKDPDSAKFGQFTALTENAAWLSENAACLTVNARNSLGGYTGDQQALLFKEKGIWRVVSISMQTHESCIEIMSSRLR